ncbi:alpha/beta hydrolase fold domain-containing protein [Streptomyces sp. PTD5-9]|uniref:alpha/beta hydrolase fold domain-containing protein n=1 Tax=Streptomyces sp. PTD5-9 TaxID=3120150 RepID=UPI00300A81BD
MTDRAPVTPVTPVAPVPEPAATGFAQATAEPPYLFQIPPAEGRKAVDEVQSGPVAVPAVDEEWATAAGGPTGEVRARVVRPSGTTRPLPVVLCPHGAGRMFSPVTDASFDTGSHHRFAEGYFLRRDGMQWFWDQCTTDETDRARITASPLRAAGVPVTAVRHQGVIHDFVMLDALRETYAAQSAIELATRTLHKALTDD